MKKLTAIQTNAITAYAKFLDAGQSYGDAMREAAKSLGETPCLTLLTALAEVHAAKYKCNFTTGAAGGFVFYNGDESTRDSRNHGADKSWKRNVMVWFTVDKAKKPVKSARLTAEARQAAKAYLAQFDNMAQAIAALKAVAAK
jgi:hypothetical protein